jgi:hypothetical protein
VGTSCDELKDLRGWKSRVMVDRYAKLATEHQAAAAARIEGIQGKTGTAPYVFPTVAAEARKEAPASA